MRTILLQFCVEGGGVCRGPRTTTSFGPQHELPLARLVIHRQTSAHEQRRERLKVRFEVGHISVFLPPASLAVDNGRAPHFQRAPAPHFQRLILSCAYLYTDQLRSRFEVPICTLTVYKGVN